MKRFIIRCLIANVEPSFAIKDYLMRTDFWDDGVEEEISDNFYNEFPDGILISNTVSMLDCINEFKKKILVEEQKRDS